MQSGGHTRKKPKIEIDDASLAPLMPLAYDSAKRATLQEAFAAAEPFPHAIVSELSDSAFLKDVREQVISQLKADYKETDIFKVLQTGDLANLDAADSRISALVKLRDTIYSSEFRSFVQDVTQCPPLTDQVDCSCNIYPESGHLLCHDDVIGSRCVSYIIYLTDPDLQWAASDGGALELYSIGENDEPLPAPSKKILPEWNQMVLFCVEPDVSFHSVEEVRQTENHRLSISGWFHTAAEHVKIAKSSLHQLQSEADGKLPLFTFEPEIHGDALSEADTDYLREWINGSYLKAENIEKVYQSFKEEGSIQLRNFLKESVIADLLPAIAEADSRLVEQGRSMEGWHVQGPPHKHRYLQWDRQEEDRVGIQLGQIERHVFQSTQFRRFLHQLTGIDTLGGGSEVRCFRPGSDYTIALYDRIKQETLDAVLCFVHCPEEDAQSQWDHGEVGGFEAYLLADVKEEEAADVYRANDEDSGVLSVSPVSNTLNLVLSDAGLIKFVKYVSAAAPGCRWDISAEYSLHDSAPEPSEATSDEPKSADEEAGGESD